MAITPSDVVVDLQDPQATYSHRTATFESAEGFVEIDVVELKGSVWLSAQQALFTMGFPEQRKGGYGRMLQRINPSDVVKIKDTPFRFPEGRRNRGSLISPRAILELAYGKRTQGLNPFKARPFAEWMTETLLNGEGAEAWSPPRRKPQPTLEPVFRAVITAIDEDEQGRPLDPLRPTRPYHGTSKVTPIRADEVEFCLCPLPNSGHGACWCGGKGGVRATRPEPFVPYEGDEVIDENDVFDLPSLRGQLSHPPQRPRS